MPCESNRTEDLDEPPVPGCMAEWRRSHAAVRMPDGNVLVTGGEDGQSSAEVYITAERQFVATGSMTTPRELHHAVLLPNGKPLVIGGWRAITPGRATETTEIYTAVPATVPGPPVIGVATAGNTQATVKFSTPVSDGGMPLKGYTVTSIPAGGVDTNAGSLSREHVVANLTNGVSYRFTVTATNAVGTSVPSAASNAITPGPNAPAICAGFNDVDSADLLCRNVEWLRNRAITLGCTPITFCPNDPVWRLQMAAFMNRLGTALTPVELKVESMSGPPALGGTGTAGVVACQTDEFTPSARPAWARPVGVLMGTASALVGIRVETVQSTNGGVSWATVSLGTNDTLRPARWTSVRALGSVALNANQTSRFGLRVQRMSGTVDVADSRCLLARDDRQPRWRCAAVRCRVNPQARRIR